MKPTLILLLLLFVGCNSEKRCQMHKEKALNGGCLKIDTLRFSDTIKGFSIDTVFQFDTLSKTDTLTVEKNGIKTITVIKWKERTIEHQVVQHDTIKHYVKPILKDKCPELTWWHKNGNWVCFILGILTLWILDRVITKIFGK